MTSERLIESITRATASVPVALCLTAVLAGAAPENPVRIDTTRTRYALQNFSFEVSPDTGNAAIRLEYSYPAAWLEGDYSDRGPGARIAMLRGLTYDAAAHAVVYDDGARRTTCATEVDHKVLLWKTVRMKPTGACTVSAHVIHHADNNGWSTRRFDTLDTWFEIRNK